MHYNRIFHYTFLGLALIEMGESLKQMADVKYSLDDNIKQNFLEPLHHLQTKDLKEVMVSKLLHYQLELLGILLLKYYFFALIASPKETSGKTIRF